MTPSPQKTQESIIQEKSNHQCRRCGECCSKGGPALHLQDKDLVNQNLIPIQRLFTIRRGEPVLDNVRERIIWASSDIIKIKGTGATWTCIYFDKTNNCCSIYQHRPLECQIFKCWNTAEIESLYQKDYLTRLDLISEVEGLWELVEAHQQACSYKVIRQMLESSPNHLNLIGEDQLKEMISYDNTIRAKTTELIKIDPQWNDFIFGHPLSLTIKRVGLIKTVKDNRYRLMKGEPSPPR